jgi:15-cis-phytoene synthase
MNVSESYSFCEAVARREAKNFYYSFLLLDAARRRAMCAIYAFMRYCDDLSDSEAISGVAQKAAAITRWRGDLEAAFEGRTPEHALLPAFIDAVARYRIPHQYFFEMIDGVSSDLEPRCVHTFEDLYDYCYHVASVVGLTVVHIFGFRPGFHSPEALKLAEKCGIAFQLTNILRDVREDAENQRVYLPQEDLERFHVTADDLRGQEISPRLKELLAFEAGRARQYYRESAPLVGMIDPASRASLRALIGIYSRLLERIVESGFDVLTHRIRVPTWEKVGILVRSRWG